MPPNVLIVVVDTLRADRMTPYGYDRDTSPAIARLLADRGAVFEQAYAVAPWTLPSMEGLMTGRFPGELSRGTPGSFSLPEGVPVLAERMQALGYATAAFYGNPTLHAGNGYARGFDTYYSAPPDLASLRLHADSIFDRALPWLREHGSPSADRPFFLYVHFLDPHDPYQNPANEERRWPWLPPYHGPLTGDSVNALYVGAVSLGSPEDVAWISSLYDGEVAWVDGFVGKLVEALDPQVRAHTLIVLTADHGEELHDHGGWKHGESLYQEQIHVPLILRWDDGPVPPGARIEEPVSLLDLMPTVLAAAGGPGAVTSTPGLEGIDLLPRLTEGKSLPLRTFYFRHFGRGPLRAGVLRPPYKLVLFNRAAPFEPADSVEDHLWRLDLDRLERVELYDLVEDPHERHNLAAERPEVVARLAPEILRHLDRELSGIRLMAAPSRGGRVEGSVELGASLSGWSPLFLREKDRVDLDGRRLSFDLSDDVFAKGLLLDRDASVAGLRIQRAGSEGGREAVLIGPDRPYRHGPLDPRALETDRWPGRWPEGVLVRVWTRELRPVTTDDPETVRRLRNLGYAH